MERKPHILLVDDEERFAESMQTILHHYGYDCTYAVSGDEAFQYLKESLFDVVLLDVQLPDVSGCTIAEHIKTNVHGTAAIMLTGMNSVETAVESLQSGAYDFLRKPINHERLLHTIEKALEHNALSERLEESNNRFKAFAEATWEGIVIHRDGLFIEANNQFLDMFAYTPAELENTNILELLFPADLQRAKDRLNGSSGIFELTGRKKDGSEFPVEVNVREIEYHKDTAMVCSVRDISTRIHAEEEKLFLQNKLAQAQKLKALGMMAGSVAHDLNNILTGIVTYPDLLLHQMGESNEFYPSIKKIQEAGKRASAVVKDLVMMARGRLPQTIVENINDIVLNYLQSIEHTEKQAKYPGVLIQTELQSDLLNCYCSAQHINKILMNLITNAMEAVEENGLIKIHTRNITFKSAISNEQQRLAPAGEYIQLTITDNGIGIGARDKDQVFDPFFTTKTKGGGKSGTGLGLAIVWNTVQEHNGWIELGDNNPGTRFDIYLPGTHDHPGISNESVNQATMRGEGQQILLVDDEHSHNELMDKLLENLGYRTHAVNSGEDALAYLRDNSVDMVILDMNMGKGLNGRETYEQILTTNPSQRAIVISGYADAEEIARMNELGASYILEKPVTLVGVGMAIKKTLSGH